MSSPNLAPIAIAVAPNGGRRSKADHPAIPTTAAELATIARECAAAGAAMLHLHIRDAEGKHLLEANAYRHALAAVHQAIGKRLVVQITSESVGQYGPSEQMAVIRDVRPEAVSIAPRELVPDAGGERDFAAFLEWMRVEHVVPQFILYSPQEVLRLRDLMQRGLVPWENVAVLYVLGSYTSLRVSEPTDLLPFVAEPMPRFANWMVCAFGRHEAACVTYAALMGGHVRVGFENNLHRPDGTLAPDNTSQIQAAAQLLRATGLDLLSGDQLRAVWAGLR